MFAFIINALSQTGGKHFQISVNSTNFVIPNTDDIGKLHNEGLDYTLSKLANNTKIDRASFVILFNQTLTEFYNSKGFPIN